MSENNAVYSIQRTYILTHVLTPEREIVTCNQRIDIPTIEPLPSVKPVYYDGKPLTVIPCIELAGEFLSEFNLTFETNEGEIVLPLNVPQGSKNSLKNPYLHPRYVLVLPRGATGVKSCKLIHKATGKEVQHNFTFGIMPPPYNYDNMLFGYNQFIEGSLFESLDKLTLTVNRLALVSKTKQIGEFNLRKYRGEQSKSIGDTALYFTAVFSYSPTTEETVHHPVISIKNIKGKYSYTLALNRASQTVFVDLLMSMITVYDSNTGEVMQQFKFPLSLDGFSYISFANFDDIADSELHLDVKGRPLK